MIDRSVLRDQLPSLVTACKNRGDATDVAALAAQDAEVRRLKHESEALRAQAKAASKSIGDAVKRGLSVDEAKAQARAIGDQATELEKQTLQKDAELSEKLLYIPNPCLAEVPIGADASQNPVHSTWGQVPKFAFPPLPHWELATKTGIIVLERDPKRASTG